MSHDGSGETSVELRDRVTGVADGRVVPITDSPLLTSATKPWAGLLFEIFDAQVVRGEVTWGWNKAHICLVTRGSINFRLFQSGESEDFQGRAGSVYVWPAGFDGARFTHAESDFQLICVQLDPAKVSTLLERQGPSADDALLPQVAVRDPAIERLLRSMAEEVSGGCPSGSLYGQSLSLALSTYLEGRFSANRLAHTPCEGKLSDQHVRQIVDYIVENMGSDFDLDELSKSLSISPRHFFRLFSNTFGTTPHRYIMKRRVDRAKSLLVDGLSIAIVAQELGFASQSHFTSVFRKIAGTPPGQFRAEELNLSNSRARAQKR